MTVIESKAGFTATRNACKLCTPFGACMAYKGVRGAMPFLHGSQGCSTYIRRYMISHFKEPVDIASSNFTEDTAIFGGGKNFALGLANVIRQYNPELIGIATTCLSETIGDDVPMMLKEFRKAFEGTEIPELVHVSTPSYSGTHADGFFATLRALVEGLAEGGVKRKAVNIISGMISPADIRHLKDMVASFGIESVLLPDYSDTLDGPAWSEYHNLPEGGTTVDEIRSMGSATQTVEFVSNWDLKKTAGAYLENRFGVKNHAMPLPIGLRQTDRFLDVLEEASGMDTPERYVAERGRLIDAYVDAHKYIFDKRAVVFGEEDFITGIVSFLAEVGIRPVVVLSGGNSGNLRESIAEVAPEISGIEILDGSDFEDMAEEVAKANPDILIGNSKGYTLARALDLPLVRVGFPVHDRIGGARLLHVGYKGALSLLDSIANAIIDHRQRNDDWGYTYM
ncbi:MAG: nitrogenase [Planctomycetes bacterium]|nr:nitrogenase [Planctomycetota bacterium]